MPARETYCIDTHTMRFDTEEKCQDFLVQSRWNGRPTCPKCGNYHMNYYLAKRRVYKCSKCYKQFSVKQGTIFENSKIPLTKWFKAMYYFTTIKRGLSSIQLGKWLGVKQHTAWFMMHRLREALKDENNIILQGIVETDECFVGPVIARDKRLQMKRKAHNEEQDKIHGIDTDRARRLRGYDTKRGRKKGETKEVIEQRKREKALKGDRIKFERNTVILGMMEHNGRAVMIKLGKSGRDVNRDRIFPLLKKHINSKSIFITDQLNLYDEVGDMFIEHLRVNHKYHYVINGVHINGIENAWNHLQRIIDGTYFHISFHHFDRYLNENTYRWNRRKESTESLFESFVPLVTGKTLTYKKLIQKEERLAA